MAVLIIHTNSRKPTIQNRVEPLIELITPTYLSPSLSDKTFKVNLSILNTPEAYILFNPFY